MNSLKCRGFTLVEIMVVVAVIGLLAVVGIPYVFNAFANSKVQVKARNIAEVEKAKLILALPPAAHIVGAMGLERKSMMIQDDPVALSNLCAGSEPGT
jgi:prepilin-type N-terminal cleavage/methylation domain-containing protein